MFGNRHQLNRMERKLDRIYRLAVKIFLLVLRLNKPKGQRKLHLGIKFLVQKGGTMALDPIKLFADQKLLLTVMPKNEHGENDNDVDVEFSSNDASVGIEEQADGRSAFILTPAEAGSAVISIAAAGYPTETVAVSYSAPAARSLNVSVGAPQSDL